MDLGSWRTQLRKGAAELAVLTVLGSRDRYGLEILETINEAGLEITEGTLYPLLNRLQRDGKIESDWRQDEGASHPRKYYRTSHDGARLLAEMRPHWQTFSAALSGLIEDHKP